MKQSNPVPKSIELSGHLESGELVHGYKDSPGIYYGSSAAGKLTTVKSTVDPLEIFIIKFEIWY